MELQKKVYNVVAAVVCCEGKYLCMQKGKTKFDYTSFRFEFPGGKVESGETYVQALKRELLEEMNYKVEVKEKLISVYHQYPDFAINLTAFLCTAETKEFTMKEHISFHWLAADQLESLSWAAADIDVVKTIVNSH